MLHKRTKTQSMILMCRGADTDLFQPKAFCTKEVFDFPGNIFKLDPLSMAHRMEVYKLNDGVQGWLPITLSYFISDPTTSGVAMSAKKEWLGMKQACSQYMN